MRIRAFVRDHIVGDPAAVATYRTARRELEEYDAHQCERYPRDEPPPTAEGARLVARVAETEQHLPLVRWLHEQ